jgi:thioredoxin-dependent peroxiredoxin
VGLADFAGRKLVLYFYPRADTSGCTREAIDFSQLKAAFSRAGTEILGISADPVAALGPLQSQTPARNRFGIGRNA